MFTNRLKRRLSSISRIWPTASFDWNPSYHTSAETTHWSTFFWALASCMLGSFPARALRLFDVSKGDPIEYRTNSHYPSGGYSGWLGLGILRCGSLQGRFTIRIWWWDESLTAHSKLWEDNWSWQARKSSSFDPFYVNEHLSTEYNQMFPDIRLQASCHGT